MSQRHEDYYGFVKTGFEKYRQVGIARPDIFELLAPFSRFWLPYWRPSDLEWGSKNRPFWKQIKKNEKKEVQEAALTKT